MPSTFFSFLLRESTFCIFSELFSQLFSELPVVSTARIARD
ncbi:Uncharacterised protein [Plesiomonas shigelloides]|nr:Uncharacterised protein [Plesiomonas shigelloides]